VTQLLVVPVVLDFQEFVKFVLLLLEQVADLFEFFKATFGIMQNQLFKCFLHVVEQILLAVS